MAPGTGRAGKFYGFALILFVIEWNYYIFAVYY